MATHDTELMRRWQNGDATAFETLVQRWQQPIARFLARWVGRNDLVPDLSQEVFLRLYHAGANYRETGQFSAWFYRIALNVARDAGRRERRRPKDLPLTELPETSQSIEQSRDLSEVRELLNQEIAKLPEPLRLVVVLRHYENLNFEEIARLTDTPASTLKSRFGRALQHLRVRLESEGWGPDEVES